MFNGMSKEILFKYFWFIGNGEWIFPSFPSHYITYCKPPKKIYIEKVMDFMIDELIKGDCQQILENAGYKIKPILAIYK